MKKHQSIFSTLLLTFALITSGLMSCSQSELPISKLPKPADLILFNAVVYTVHDQQPWAKAVAIKNGDTIAVGSTEEMQQWRGDNTQQQDLAGKMLLPGFIDSHAHPVMGGAYVRSLSLDTFATPTHWLKQISDYTKQNPKMKVLFGYGFLVSAFGPEDQFNRYFRFNSLKKAGVKMSFGSDFSASGAGTLGMSPIFNMEIGHTRQNPGEKNSPIQPGKHERIDIATLIKGYTIDGAYQLHMEDKIGSIEVGKKADFVVLDKTFLRSINTRFTRYKLWKPY